MLNAGILSSSSSLVLVPDLAGLDTLQANALIQSLQFTSASSTTTATGATSSNNGLIASQSLVPNTLAERYTTLSYVTYAYVAPPPPPPPPPPLPPPPPPEPPPGNVCGTACGNCIDNGGQWIFTSSSGSDGYCQYPPPPPPPPPPACSGSFGCGQSFNCCSQASLNSGSCNCTDLCNSCGQFVGCECT